jgi:hypothetical protein
MQPQFENVYQPGQEGMLQQMAGPAMQAALAYGTGGLSGMGAMGRGAMDSYRGRPSGATQSAYQNLFGNNQQSQQGGASQGQMQQQYQPQQTMAGYFNPTTDVKKPWRTPGIRQASNPQAWGGNPQLNQLLSRVQNPGLNYNEPQMSPQAPRQSATGGMMSGIDKFWNKFPELSNNYGLPY